MDEKFMENFIMEGAECYYPGPLSPIRISSNLPLQCEAVGRTQHHSETLLPHPPSLSKPNHILQQIYGKYGEREIS